MGLTRFKDLVQGIPSERPGDPIRSVGAEIVEIGNVGNDLSLAQRTSEGILRLRTLMRQLVGGDDKSKGLLLNYFREGIEEKCSRASARVDEARFNNLKRQMKVVDEGLSAILGKKTTIMEVYKCISRGNSEYPPILTPEGKLDYQGFFGLLKFQNKLAIKILSTGKVASESAEIEAQTVLVPLKEELKRLEISEKGKTAHKFVETGEIVVKAEEVKGEIRISRIRNITTPLIITIAETPITFLQAPVDRLGKWMDEAQDKAVPIAAVGGAVAGPMILFTRIAASSPIIESWLAQNVVLGAISGIFGGALVSVAAWGTIKNILPALKNAFSYTVEELGKLRRVRRE